jgi:HD superfamily phosphohydrolase
MHWGARRHDARVVRDPIHGDILLPPIAAAVVGSLEFQRLRYIRQNGLLHFVFPGAVHTRFAHSLGTMANAQAVWYRLTADLAEREKTEAFAGAREYLGEVFELAALLHDVGHCAFSHASEQVEVKGHRCSAPFASSSRSGERRRYSRRSSNMIRDSPTDARSTRRSGSSSSRRSSIRSTSSTRSASSASASQRTPSARILSVCFTNASRLVVLGSSDALPSSLHPSSSSTRRCSSRPSNVDGE